MDLHVVGPLASPEERAAVDGVLGPPPGGWAGGDSIESADGRAARGGQAARARRTLLLPVLHAIQDRIGHISAPALNYACRRLTIPPAEAYGVASFYALLATKPRPAVAAHVCDDIACRLAGAGTLCADVARQLGPEGSPLSRLDGRAAWFRSPCLGQCERGPAALITASGAEPARLVATGLDAAGLARELEALTSPATVAGGSGERAAPPGHRAVTPGFDRLAAIQRSVPQAGEPGLRLLARVGVADPESLESYKDHGGYRALASAIAMGATRVIDELASARLVGRGGAAFPTARKWAAARAAVSASPGPVFVVCNADESEPGTFKDRVVLEEDPFAIVEAMTVAALAVGATRGFIYLRGEYPLAERRLLGAIDQARAAGLLGEGIRGTTLQFDIELRRGAGAYVCGEETALFESIEGRRGEPRNKPPFPVEVGLFGRPTVINNVETLANVLLILGGDPGGGSPGGGEPGGGARFARTGTEGSTGTKLYCLSGHVARPGVYEVPFGATIGDLVAQAGGVPGGRAVRAILLGGAAGTFVGREELATPLTFEGTRAVGSGLGSGAVVVFNETADLADTIRRIARFFRDESCGQCVPCRVGTVRQEELLARLAAGSPARPAADELAILRELGQVMRDASICGLGQTATAAVESAIGRRDLVGADGMAASYQGH
jgi:NADH-quinone oxidoreductase subunit F